MKYLSKADKRMETPEFPAFTGERVYMVPFLKKEGLPDSLSRWQPLVSTMLCGVHTELPIFLMIDQKKLLAGEFHRRPGLHIDGYWQGDRWGHQIKAHGGTTPSHRAGPSRTSHSPTYDRHDPNPRIPFDTHAPTPPKHMAGGDWGTATFDQPEAIILASNVVGCDGFVGRFEGPVGDMGDCANIDVSGLDRFTMQANRVYAGNVSLLHESTPVAADCLRTVVRLNVPGWTV